jgi:hypothetical protein
MTPKFLFQNPMGLLESQICGGKFLGPDVAENFTIDVVCVV